MQKYCEMYGASTPFSIRFESIGRNGKIESQIDFEVRHTRIVDEQK